jgi:hypothetical protein
MYESPFLHHILAPIIVMRERRQSAALTTFVFFLLEEPEMYIWLVAAVLACHAW